MSEWIEITEGCRMPTDGQSVIVTCAYENPGDGIPFVDRGFYLCDPTNEATDRKDWFNVMDWPHYRRQNGTYKTKYGSIITAWMPAPEPFRRVS